MRKENVIQTLNAMPDKFTLDESKDELVFVNKVNQGLKKSENGEINTEEEAKEI